MRFSTFILVSLLLIACGGSAVPQASQVESALIAAGASDMRDEPLQEGAPVPRSFTARKVFTIASVAPRGGQYFICQDKRGCDAIFAYFDAFKALAGPYLYQSDGGLVVIQLNSGLKPEEAGKFEQAVKGLP